MSEAAEADSKAAAVDLSSLGLYSQDDAGDSAFARLLLLGPPKVGKTTCVATTAPKPLIINCDGDSATKYAAKQGATFAGIDVHNRATWVKAQQAAKKAVDADIARTVIVDTITLLADNLLDEISMSMTGFDRFNELASHVVGGIKRLFKLPAHVIVIAHMVPDHDTEAGVVPLIAGQAKVKIPALAHDCVLFDYSQESGRRQFLVGPQKNWTYSGRNVKRSCVTAATIPALFNELGIAL